MRGQLICGICPHGCRLDEGQTGVCRARRNSGGQIVPLAYGKPCAVAVDPMEKKPLFHFRPGTRILSLGMAGSDYVYCGNFDENEDTVCPRCGALLVRRRGFDVIENAVRGGACPRCGGKVYGRF